jgi:hypothetical protein
MLLVAFLLEDACVGFISLCLSGYDFMLNPCLVFGLVVASLLRIAAAIGLCYTCWGKGYYILLTKCWKNLFYKIKKTTKISMNHLGGMWLVWFLLSGCLGSCHRTSEPLGVSHLWTATQEQRYWRRSSHGASSATTRHYGLCLDQLSCKNSS